MAKTDFQSVDEYIATHPSPVQTILRSVRAAIREAMPAAEEGISYQIPAYRLGGRAVLYFAAWKRHYSLYPVDDRLVATFAEELAPYEVSKGTIRLPLTEAVPVRLIERIARYRADEAAEGSRTKRSTPPKRRATGSTH
jgi:uncharacterized protein YdhG (YjbR/CyaY superfamily)